MGNEADFLVREFDRAGDMPMVVAWWEGHNRPPVPVEVLPKLGVVVFRDTTREDLAALWLYMDNSVGVCFLERAVTRPGLSFKEARGALLRGIDYLKHAAAAMDYGVMMLRTYAGMARVARQAGFIADEKPIVSMSMFTRSIERKEELCQ